MLIRLATKSNCNFGLSVPMPMKHSGNPKWSSVVATSSPRSVEEYEAAIKLYRGFVERFPASSRVAEAKAQIVSLEKGL
jgi:hypothetical protein